MKTVQAIRLLQTYPSRINVLSSSTQKMKVGLNPSTQHHACALSLKVRLEYHLGQNNVQVKPDTKSTHISSRHVFHLSTATKLVSWSNVTATCYIKITVILWGLGSNYLNGSFRQTMCIGTSVGLVETWFYSSKKSNSQSGIFKKRDNTKGSCLNCWAPYMKLKFCEKINERLVYLP